jgi:hypothetical protein
LTRIEGGGNSGVVESEHSAASRVAAPRWIKAFRHGQSDEALAMRLYREESSDPADYSQGESPLGRAIMQRVGRLPRDVQI